MIRRFLVSLLTIAAVRGAGAEASPLLGYDPLPLGSINSPLVLRSYFPDPDLDPAVFAHHHNGQRGKKYASTTGEDAPGEIDPIKGVPDAIGVNHGHELSYLFDTIECRLLYAWKGGFFDMYPYWGDEKLGTRMAFDYLPRLVGTVFYKTSGRHPLEIGGRSVSELGPPRFVGYDVAKGQPTFITRHGAHTVRTRVVPSDRELGFSLEITTQPATTLSYRQESPDVQLKQESTVDGGLRLILTGKAIASFSGYSRDLKITRASADAGEQLYRNYGCIGCHTTDGSAGHGPSFGSLFERERPLADGTKVVANENYLRESMKTPNAKIAQGFGPNLMPVYPLKDIECESLVLFIKSLRQPD